MGTNTIKTEETDNTDARSTIALASDLASDIASLSPSEMLDENKSEDTENQIPLPDNAGEKDAMSTDD